MDNTVTVALKQQKMEKVKHLFFKALPYILCFGYMAIRMMMMVVFGEPSGASQAFSAIATVLQPLLTAIGALFILIGVIRYAIAHSQEDSPTQQKAAMMIGTGIALVVLGGMATTIVSGFGSLVQGGNS